MLGLLEDNKITKWPLDVIDLRVKYPNTSFPDDISSTDLTNYGVITIQEVSQPSYDRKTQKIAESDPVLDGETWKQNWIVTSLTSDEIAARDSEHWIGIRRVRDELLAECDWRACSDRTMSEDWKTYRQALRDITTQSDPYNITWPTIPS
tara:strand:- start:65 stop:514 length:450 start_codon:yes stop_codon:yes gene_type:complete